MHKTPAVRAGVSDQRGSDPFPHTRTRSKLEASDRARARLRWHLRFFPWMLAKRRRIAA